MINVVQAKLHSKTLKIIIWNNNLKYKSRKVKNWNKCLMYKTFGSCIISTTLRFVYFRYYIKSTYGCNRQYFVKRNKNNKIDINHDDHSITGCQF